MYRFGKAMWVLGETPGRDPRQGTVRPLLVGWAVILTALALLPVNSHPWYWTWPIVPLAVLVTFDRQSTPSVPRWFRGYLALTAVMTLAYHTRIVHL
jgi:hypothetical protein